jgi:hypothetical protein
MTPLEQFIIFYILVGGSVTGVYIWSGIYKQRSFWKQYKENYILYPRPYDIYSHINTETGKIEYTIIGKERWEKAMERKEEYLEEQERKENERKNSKWRWILKWF